MPISDHASRRAVEMLEHLRAVLRVNALFLRREEVVRREAPVGAGGRRED